MKKKYIQMFKSLSMLMVSVIWELP